MTQQTQVPEVSDELKAFVGRPMRRQVSDPVTESDIRRWAIAVYWPEKPPRLFWDEEYAKSTRFGGIVGPDEFNPFAWPIDPGETLMTDDDLAPAIQRMGIGMNVLNGGGGNTYFDRIRPGDVISSETVLDQVYTRPGRLGVMLFLIRKTTWTNQHGKKVRESRGIGIKY